MGTTTAGITGGNPVPMTIAQREITEHFYGIAPTEVDVKSGTAANNFSVYIAFDHPTLFIILEAKDNAFDIQFSLDGGVTYEDTKVIEVANPMTIPFTATGFRIRNTVTDAGSDYEVTGLGARF